MGKKSKTKKKGENAEKTLLKTEKKWANKMKKQLQASGEDDIDAVLAEIEKKDREMNAVVEKVVDPPSRRINFSFVAHPDKEQLILFGGEFFNGQKTFVYNDLFLYNISNNTWKELRIPNCPPPRCGHQMVITSANKGQLWVFGGEFVSPSQEQFRHYRDLWVLHLEKKQWEKINAANGPSARSGHRMVYNKKQLIVFGGYHDNLRDYRYFNDCYAFNVETYQWTKLETTGIPPAPRSGCCMVTMNDGRILIYGGYSKEKVKKDVDKGQVYSDTFVLTPDKQDTTGSKWKWVTSKTGGFYFSPRCSMPMIVTPNNLLAYCYGGVFDVKEDDEELSGIFYNDFLQLDLEKLCWSKIIPSCKKDSIKVRPKKNTVEEPCSEEMEIDDEVQEMVKTTRISDDGIFKVTVGSASSTQSQNNVPSKSGETKVFQPSSRINCGLAIKHGTLYLYGGMYEDDDKEVTFSDLYSIDLKKQDEWKTISPDDTTSFEWLGSSSSESDDESNSDESDMDSN